MSVVAPGRGGDEFLAQAISLIRAQHTVSARLASAYFTQSRRMALPEAEPFEPKRPELPDEAVTASMVGAGFKLLSEAIERGETLADALESAGENAARAGVRLGLSGGRGLIQDASLTKGVALGYYWQTRTDGQAPCYWCAMLASRGPVFSEKSWEDADPRPNGLLKVSAHDRCACHLAPVFVEGQQLPDYIDDLGLQWLTVTNEFTGKAKMREWRKWYDATLRSSQASNRDAA